MPDFEMLLKGIAGLLILYVVIKVAAGIIAIMGYVTNLSNFLNSIPYLNTIILVLLALVVGYYVFVK